MWSKNLPPLPPRDEPEQYWFFHGKISPADAIGFHVIWVARMGEPSDPWVLYGLRSSSVDPKGEAWEGQWLRIPFPSPPEEEIVYDGVAFHKDPQHPPTCEMWQEFYNDPCPCKTNPDRNKWQRIHPYLLG